MRQSHRSGSGHLVHAPTGAPTVPSLEARDVIPTSRLGSAALAASLLCCNGSARPSAASPVPGQQEDSRGNRPPPLSRNSVPVSSGSPLASAWDGSPVLAPLPRGPYRVGFRRAVRFSDLIRRETERGDQAWASVLSIWYPAEPAAGSRAMALRDHLNFGLADTRAAWLEPRFRANAERVLRRDILGEDETAAGAEHEERFARVLALRSFAVDGAPWARGSFPVVVWHPGADSTVTDGVLFAELAASHGFVVVTAAFPSHDRERLITSDFEATDEDVHAAAETLRDEPGADLHRIAMVGHSLGAQRALMFGARRLFPRAIVSFDTTWDSESTTSRWATFTPEYREIKAKADAFRVPLLAFAPAAASFTLLRSLAEAPRWLVTSPDMEHDDYTYHGPLSVLYGRDESEGQGRARLRATRAVYLVTLAFLKAQLRGDGTAASQLALPGLQALKALDADGAGLDITYLPAAERGPNGTALLARAMQESGEAAARLCALPGVDTVRTTRCREGEILDAVDALVAEGQGARAIALTEHGVNAFPRSADMLRARVRVSLIARRPRDARAALDALRKVETSLPWASARLLRPPHADLVALKAFHKAAAFRALENAVHALERGEPTGAAPR